MQPRKFLKSPALFFCITALSLCAQSADPGAEMPKPIELGSNDVSVYITIPQPAAFIKSIEQIANKFAPAPMPPGTMKAQFGAMVSDPDLAGLDLSKPIMLMILKAPPVDPAAPPAPPPMAIFIPVKNAQVYKTALETLGKMKVEIKDNIVIASDTPERLAKAVALKSVYDKIDAAEIKSEIRAFVSIEQLAETYGKQIDAGLEGLSKTFAQMPPNPAAPGMDPKALGVIMKVYAKAISAMVKQSQAMQLDLSYKNDAVQQDVLFIAKPETTLAKLFVAPAPGEIKMLPLLRPGALMGSAFRMNPAATKAFMDAIIPDLEKDTDLKEIVDEKLIALMKDGMQIMGDEMVMAMLPVEKGFPVTRSAFTVTDEKKYLELLEKSMAAIGPDGFLGKLYANMGLSMKFERNVRKHAGVDIHCMKMAIDAKKMPPQQAAQMQSMMRDTELAVTKGTYLTATDPAELDQMINQLNAGLLPKDGAALKSMKTFGPKQHFYLDYDVIGLMKAMLSADPNNPMAGIFTDVKGGEPMQGAGLFANGRSFTQVIVPLAPFIQMAKVMQQMAGPGIKPPPKPPDNPGQF